MGDTEKNKSAFEAITSQEALDKIVESRLARERAKYTGFEDFKAKAAKLDETVEELNTTRQQRDKALGEVEVMRKAAELSQVKATVAKETGVPVEMLRGQSEEELKDHAKQLKQWAAGHKVAPIVPSQGAQPSADVSESVQAVRRLFAKQ